MARSSDRIDTIVSLSRRRGFVYPSSEIYGGLRASWDYGPLGVEMKNNIKRQWWRSMVTERDDIVGIDSSVILAREVWELGEAHSRLLSVFAEPSVPARREWYRRLGHSVAEETAEYLVTEGGLRSEHFTEARLRALVGDCTIRPSAEIGYAVIF